MVTEALYRYPRGVISILQDLAIYGFGSDYRCLLSETFSDQFNDEYLLAIQIVLRHQFARS